MNGGVTSESQYDLTPSGQVAINVIHTSACKMITDLSIWTLTCLKTLCMCVVCLHDFCMSTEVAFVDFIHDMEVTCFKKEVIFQIFFLFTEMNTLTYPHQLYLDS